MRLRVFVLFRRPLLDRRYDLSSAAAQDYGLVGSITPNGGVQIVFLRPSNQNPDIAIKTTGTGQMRKVNGQRKFEMQMTTGTTSLITHWAFMTECKNGQKCERRLPGTESSLEQFVRPCPSQ